MSTQVLSGLHTASGRSVKATPLPGQVADGTTVDTAAVTTDSAGAWSLTLLQGVIYELKIEKWGMKTIQITDDAVKDFATYIGDNALMGGPQIGTIKWGSSYIRPVLLDDAGEVVDPATVTSTEGLSLSWEIV